MGTEVLRPQDVMIERMRYNPSVFPRRKPHYTNNNNNKSARKSVTRMNSKPRFPQSEPLKTDLAMGQVTILKRGEFVDFRKKNDKPVVEVNRPVQVPRRIRVVVDRKPVGTEEVYAGSAVYTSPSPRALPLPSFSKKKEDSGVVDDSATRDLRRLLGLD